MSKESQENEDAVTPRHAENGTKELPANEITPEITSNIMAIPCQIYSPQSESISGFGNPMGYPTYPLNFGLNFGQMVYPQTIRFPASFQAPPSSFGNNLLYSNPGSIPMFTNFGTAFPHYYRKGGTGSFQYHPSTVTKTDMNNGDTIITKLFCITTMEEYEGKSIEELRMEDYMANRKGPQAGARGEFLNISGSSLSDIFEPRAQQETGIFGQYPKNNGLFVTNDRLTGFGQQNAFGAAPTTCTSGFGFGNTANNASSNLFGAKPFGQPATGSVFGAAQPNAAGVPIESIGESDESKIQIEKVLDFTNEVNPNATPITENPQVQDVTNKEIPSTDPSLIHTTNELKVLEGKIISLENTMRDENNKLKDENKELKDENKELKDKLREYKEEAKKQNKKIKHLHQKILPTWIAIHGIPKNVNARSVMLLVLSELIDKVCDKHDPIGYVTMVPNKENDQEVIILVNFVTYLAKTLFLDSFGKMRNCLSIIIEKKDYPIAIRESEEADFEMRDINLDTDSDETDSDSKPE